MKESNSRFNNNTSSLILEINNHGNNFNSSKKFQSVTKILKPISEVPNLESSPLIRKTSNNNLNQDYLTNNH